MMNTSCGTVHGRGHAHGNRPAKSNGRKRDVICPYCHETDEVIPILYGFPTDKAFLLADRGEIYLGGLDISPYNYYCKRDDREF